MAAGARDGTLLIWFGVGVVVDTRHHAAVTCLCALEDGHWASGDAAGVVIIRNRDGVSCGLQFPSSVHALRGLAAGLLAVGTRDGVVFIHERPSWAQLPSQLRAYDHPRLAPVLCVAGLPGGGVVSAGVGGSMMQLASLDATPSPLVGHTSRVRCLLVLEDGSLVSASRDTTVRRWRQGTGTGLCCEHTLRGHNAEVAALAELGADGVLASGAADAEVRLWVGPTCIRILRGHTSPVDAIVALAGGLLASGGRSDVVRLWV